MEKRGHARLQNTYMHTRMHTTIKLHVPDRVRLSTPLGYKYEGACFERGPRLIDKSLLLSATTGG